MASVRETLKVKHALNNYYDLNILGKGDPILKDKLLEIIWYITLEKRDVIAVLSTGYGKSLLYQLIPPIIYFMEFGKRPSTAAAIVLVFSPLYVLIRDQVIKLRESALHPQRWAPCFGRRRCWGRGCPCFLEYGGTIRKPERLSVNILSPWDWCLKSLKPPSFSVASQPLSWMRHSDW